MKKIILSFSMLLASSIAIMGQTATDFTVTDCAGTSHTLFTELNAGKVIVIVWVMPCGSCIGPAQTAFGEVQSFQSSHPGRVLYYLVDDANNTSCSSLNSWATTNGISPNSVFKSAAISMTDYGTSGMPKVVVLGGAAHSVFDNQNDLFNATTLNTGIVNALNAPNSINEISGMNFELSLFPSPATTSAKVTYNLEKAVGVSFNIYNVLGEKVKIITTEKETPGKHEKQINVESLTAGVYFIQLTAGNKSEIRKFSISH